MGKSSAKKTHPYLDHHPGTCKWLITMVSPQDLRLWDPLQMAVSWLTKWGDPNHLLVLG